MERVDSAAAPLGSVVCGRFSFKCEKAAGKFVKFMVDRGDAEFAVTLKRKSQHRRIKVSQNLNDKKIAPSD